MKTWHQYCENKEKTEEKSGLDLDHDNEKGESKEHKDKIKKKKAEMIEFFTTRKSGAQKIAIEAQTKGGPSLLTAWHFKAKSNPYQEVLTAIKQNKPQTFFEFKFRSTLNKLKPNLKLTQEQFQKIVGELEVWGEVIAQLFN